MEGSAVSHFDDPRRTLLIDQWAVCVHAVGNEPAQKAGDDVTMAADHSVIVIECE